MAVIFSHGGHYFFFLATSPTFYFFFLFLFFWEVMLSVWLSFRALKNIFKKTLAPPDSNLKSATCFLVKHDWGSTCIVLFKMPINFEGCGLKKVPTKLFLRNVSGPAPPIASLINNLVWRSKNFSLFSYFVLFFMVYLQIKGSKKKWP